MVSVYRAGKTRELLSFVWWEIIHRGGLYRAGNQYVKWAEEQPCSDLSKLSFTEALALGHLQAGSAGRWEPVSVAWRHFVTDARQTRWGMLVHEPGVLYAHARHEATPRRVWTAPGPITSIFISNAQTLFFSSGGVLYRKGQSEEAFTPVLTFSTAISYFLFQHGMTEIPDQALLIGEYGSLWHGRSWQNLAYLYYSTDEGQSWRSTDFLIRNGVNKHIHIVKYSHLLRTVFLTDGDNKKQFWKNTSLTDFNHSAPSGQHTAGWHRINRYHHQTGGYTSMTETDKGVFFGSDYMGGTNFIISTCNGTDFRRSVLPDPFRRSPVMNMVTRPLGNGFEIWALTYSCVGPSAKSLLMRSTDEGQTWQQMLVFDGMWQEIRIVNAPSACEPDLFISLSLFAPAKAGVYHQTYRLSG